MNEKWTIPDKMPYSKSQWTPLADMQVQGQVHLVVLHGEVAYVDGQVLVSLDFGQNVRD